MNHRVTALLVAICLAASPQLAGCSDDTQDDIEDAARSAREDLEQAAEEGSARAVAETLRGVIGASDSDSQARSVTLLQEAADDLPGDPDIEGIEDSDGDGQDDDGLVTVNVEDESACVTIADDGSIDVTGGAC